MKRSTLLSLAGMLVLTGCGGSRISSNVDAPMPPPTAPSLGLMVTADDGGSLTVIDNAARSVARTIPLPGAPRDVVGTGDGRTVVVVVRADGEDRALLVDVRTGETQRDVVLGEGLDVSSVARTPDGRTLVTTETSRELLVLDGELAVASRIDLGETARDLLAADNARATIAAGDALILVPLGGGERRTVPVGGPAFAVSSVGTDRIAVAVARPPSVSFVTLKDLSVKTTLLPEGIGAAGVSVFPDNAAVIVSDGGILGSSIGTTVFRVSVGEGAASLFAQNVGQGPRAILVDGAGVSWTANYHSSTVTVLKPDGSFIVELPTGRHPVAITKVSAVQPGA